MYSPCVYREQLNQLGKQGTPFICLLDFENTHPQVWPLDSIDSDTVMYSTPLGTNCNSCCQSHVPVTDTPRIQTLKPLPRAVYRQGFSCIQAGQMRGESFLANLTYAIPIDLQGTLAQVYHHSHAAFKLHWKDHFTVFSPEAFVELHDDTITTRPMKGTLAAIEPQADQKLMQNEKEAAEHLTVVDLLRNDLGSIAKNVRVEKYRYLERIHSEDGDIWQTSSKISAQIPTNWRDKIGDMLFSILPAGSISGAPKKRTLELITEAEPEARGYYTGVFGHFTGEKFISAVMIRFIEARAGGLPDNPLLPHLRFRTGGGITVYSREQDEYDELYAKIKIPSRKPMLS